MMYEYPFDWQNTTRDYNYPITGDPIIEGFTTEEKLYNRMKTIRNMCDMFFELWERPNARRLYCSLLELMCGHIQMINDEYCVEADD